jgi:tetratricopeptide (TPR) repeat protein
MLASSPMRGALEGRTAIVAAAALVVGGALFLGDGSDPGPLFWIGSGAVLALALGLAVLPRPEPGRAGIALVLLLSAFAAWSAATIAWSVEPDRSWDSFNRAATYAAVLGLGLLVRSPRTAAALLAVLFAVLIGWALLSAVVPALGPDVELSARLRDPVEYWNALALAVAMALPLWLWLGRAVGAVGIFASVVALLLTQSRGGLVVAVVAVAVWLWLDRRRLDSAALLLLGAVPGAAVGAWALTTSVAEAGTDGDAGAGALLGVVLVGVGGAVFALARRPLPPWLGRAAIWVGAAAAFLVLGASILRADVWWEEFRNPPAVQVGNEPGRLGEASSNHRWTWWTQAWTIFRDDPLRGAGAGSYELARRPIREDTRGPLDPHNLGVKALSETGLVGFLLLFGAVAAGVWTAVGALRRTAGEERAAVAALAAGTAAWLVHSLLDMPWEYVAVTAPAAFAAGVLVTAGRTPAAHRRSSPYLAAAPVVVALAVVSSLALPWLAARKADASVDALVSGDLPAAAAAADDSQALNPLSVTPLHLEATAFELMDRLDEAEALYVEAVRLQPRNPQAWYELGRFEYQARDDLTAALVYLDRSWGLDRQSPDTGPLLDRVREEIERRR